MGSLKDEFGVFAMSASARVRTRFSPTSMFGMTVKLTATLQRDVA